jgi:argonaute-like protein implicated in RNA metabolism and viral defense
MTGHHRSRYSAAWYSGTREEFLATSRDAIANQLAGRAADESLEIESAQSEEWRQSVDILQESLDKRLPILREALMAPGIGAVCEWTVCYWPMVCYLLLNSNARNSNVQIVIK